MSAFNYFAAKHRYSSQWLHDPRQFRFMRTLDGELYVRPSWWQRVIARLWGAA